MASRYWVPGGTGNWNSTTNWSATSGGASGASFPLLTDDAFVDALSGTSPVITVNVASACLSLSFTGAITPTLAGSSTLNINGNLTLISAMTLTYIGQFNFSATSGSWTITTAGKTATSNMTFSGIGGAWTLQDDLAISDWSVTGGTFNSNNKTISVSANINVTGSNTRVINLGSSIINASGFVTFVATGLTLNAGTSTINMLGATKTFAGGGLTYYNVNAVGNTLTVSGNNTFNLFTPTVGNTVIFTISTTNTALTNFVFKNNTIRSTVAGTSFTLSKATGVIAFRNCSIKDCTGIGGATFSAIRGSVSVSGNTGITFGSYVVVEKQIDGRKYTLNASGVLTVI